MGSLNIHKADQVLTPFGPTYYSSTDSKRSYALQYNEETTPKFLNSLLYTYDNKNNQCIAWPCTLLTLAIIRRTQLSWLIWPKGKSACL